MKINVQLITPRGIHLSKDVNSVNIPTQEGEIGVLYGHVPLICPLWPGLVYFDGKNDEGVVVSYGFVLIEAERVLILSEEAKTVGEIDVGAEKEFFDNAMKKLASASALEEVLEAQRRLERSRVFLELAQKFGKEE
ncbi:MAG: ATP synthase F1 subunit epsilon [Aquificaceae bacterium]